MAIDGIITSAEEGNPEAQYQLAMFYIGGEEIPQDFSKAEKWLRKAIDNDYIPAKRELGILIASGSVKGKTEIEAYDLLRSLTTRMDPRAVYYLAFLYENGSGMNRDLISSIRLYGMAANLGYPGAHEDYDRVNELYTKERREILNSRPLLNLEVSDNGIEGACCKDMLDFIMKDDIFFVDSYKGPSIAALNENGEEILLDKCPFCDTECKVIEKRY
ncbi:MAG TPA: tetratricopeptide repeat protein [Candidatus Methanomethylophilaceae archaeon]|nr:tetratricopeptide repeat protein [Candidatus Methanomethylophilaceae archaeon]